MRFLVSHKDRKQNNDCQGLGERGMSSYCLMCRDSILKDEKSLEIGCKTMRLYLTVANLKIINMMHFRL